ncbi:MAG: hypothetical protein PF447_08060 [Spirochaetaceae bacterium]|jgi:hypothetical protein|nr:hypothetical protein [Spirochaetaceae bacterium]
MLHKRKTTTQTDRLYINGNYARGNVDIPSGTTMEGFIEYSIGVNTVQAIDSSHVI